MTDRVQFIQGGDPVQYPDPNLVEQVKSSLTMDLSGENIENATGFQNITMSVDHQPEDILLTLNGTGGWPAALSHTGSAGTCDVSMDFASTASGIKLWGSQLGRLPDRGIALLYRPDRHPVHRRERRRLGDRILVGEPDLRPVRKLHHPRHPRREHLDSRYHLRLGVRVHRPPVRGDRA